MLLLLLACCGRDQAVSSPWQEPPTLALDLRVTVDPKEVGLLQPVKVTIDQYRREGVDVSCVLEIDDKQFLTKNSKISKERAFGAGFWQRTTMILLPVDGPGELKIPSFRAETVASEGEDVQVATTPEQVVTVTTALLPEHGKEIEAPGDPFPTPFGGWWWVVGGVAALAFVAMILWRKQRNQPLRHALAIEVPAHVKALRALLRWRAGERGTPAEIDAFYVGVSHVLRVYLEDRFGLHAPERTTEEFLHELEGSTELTRDHRAELEDFLSQCDMVKFAAVVPMAADHDKTYQLAETFIESTRIDRLAKPSDAQAEASL